MCTATVIDTNSISAVSRRTPSGEVDQELIKWLSTGNGILIYAKHGDDPFASEVPPGHPYWHFVTQLRYSGLAELITTEDTRRAERDIKQKNRKIGALKSDDFNLLRVAVAGKAELLISNDKDLQVDFGNVNSAFGRTGKIYPLNKTKEVRHTFLEANRCRGDRQRERKRQRQ